MGRLKVNYKTGDQLTMKTMVTGDFIFPILYVLKDSDYPFIWEHGSTCLDTIQAPGYWCYDIHRYKLAKTIESWTFYDKWQYCTDYWEDPDEFD